MKPQSHAPVDNAHPGLIPFRQGDKWGYKNNQGLVVMDPLFDYAPEFKLSTELLIITHEESESKYYLYDRSGNQMFCFNDLFDEDITEINRFQESQLFYVDIYDWNGRELTGMVNEHGRVVIPAKFDSIEPIGENMFKVGFADLDGLSETDTVNMQYGVYNSEGKEIFSPQFSEVGEFECFFAIADLNDKQVLINYTGMIIADTKSNSIERISRMHYFLCRNNGIQLFLRPGELGGTYDNLRAVEGNNLYFIGERKGLSVLIDLYMHELGTYDSLEEDKDILIARNHGKWGLIDYRNQIVIPFKHDSLESLKAKNA